ncbi:hypothetical protein GF407_16060 [candidate division KSB1 bacterium]|nr:hypothetical protein [candidate division KSB1 bacterium]
MFNKIIVSVVILSYFFTSSFLLFAGTRSMTIIKVKGPAIIGNKGTEDGVQKGDTFNIYSPIDRDKLLGKARVFLVRDSLSGLKIIQKSNLPLQEGYLLVNEDDDAESLLRELENTDSYAATPNNLNTQNQEDYYYLGMEYALRDYSGGGALIGGCFSGFCFGLIGWGIGYAIAANQSVNVPHRHVSKLTTEQRMQFTEGYSQQINKKRKSKFNTGAAVGMLALVTVLVAVNSSNSN